MADRNFERIQLSPSVMVGKPVIRGTRLTVEHILNLLANDMTFTDIIDEYPGLTVEDIKACLAYASRAVAHETVAVAVS